MNLNDTERRFRFRSTRQLAELRAGRTDWYRIVNQADETDVYVYDEIGYFGTTAADFVDEINKVRTPVINLHINSPGGEIFDGISIHAALRKHKARVNVYVDSMAASIASVIAMAGDEIVMGLHSQMMIHDGIALCIGDEDMLRDTADVVAKCSNVIAGVYAERTGSMDAENVAKWRALMKAETWYDAAEAVAAGLADRIDGDGSGTENTFDLSIFNYAGRQDAPPPDGVTTEHTDADDINDTSTIDAAAMAATMREAFRRPDDE